MLTTIEQPSIQILIHENYHFEHEGEVYFIENADIEIADSATADFEKAVTCTTGSMEVYLCLRYA